MRCVIVVHPYPLPQEDTALLAESAYLPCAKTCFDDSRYCRDLYEDKRVTLNKKQKNETSNNTAFTTETNQAMWSLLTNTVPHGRTLIWRSPRRSLITSTWDALNANANLSKVWLTTAEKFSNRDSLLESEEMVQTLNN